MGYPSRNPPCFDFGPWPDPATVPRPPRQVQAGPEGGLWLVEVPGKPPIHRTRASQADLAFGWELAYWKAHGYYEEVWGDLYDRRSGKRLRHGYRELFYQISDGHQLRATLRFLEDSREGSRYVFFNDEGAAICRQCVRLYLRDLIYGMRHPSQYLLRVVGTELRYTEPLSCECCYGVIPPSEDQP
jgi:hypothetical protein